MGSEDIRDLLDENRRLAKELADRTRENAGLKLDLRVALSECERLREELKRKPA